MSGAVPADLSSRDLSQRSARPVERLVYRIGEAAEALGVTRWTINRIVRSGELATSRVGSLTVITIREVEAYLARHTTRSRPKS